MNWRDELGTRWVNWRDVIEALDRVLLAAGFPGLSQAKPTDLGSLTIRLIVEVRVDPHEHFLAPQIYMEVTKGTLNKYALEVHLGKLIAQNIRKGHDGTWRAQSADGLSWRFDKNQNAWIKEL